MFAYMHGQVLHRYNCERIANGLGLTEEFGPRQWPQGIWPGYDSQLGSVVNGNHIFVLKIFYWFKMAMTDSQQYPYKLCLTKIELDINVHNFDNF